MTLASLKRQPLIQFVLSGIRPFIREPEALAWAFAFPLLVTICMALAFGGEAKNDTIIVGIVDAPHIEASWLKAIRADEKLKAVDVPASAGQSLAKGLSNEMRDQSPELKRFVLRERLDALVTPAGIITTGVGGNDDPFVTRLRALRDRSRGATLDVVKTSVPGIRWIEWFIPGMIGLQMLSRGLNGVAVQLAEDRARGYLRRLRLSPFRKLDYLLGFGLARSLIVIFEVTVLLSIYRIFCNFSVQGGLLSFMGIALLGAVSCSLLGIAVTSRMVNQEAANGLCSAIFFPSMFASGVYFKVEKFPLWIQQLIESLPLGALNRALRLVANAGAPSIELLRPVLVLFGWGLFSLLIALRFFKWDPRESA